MHCLHVVGEDLAGSELARLAGGAVIEHADFVVRHHVAFRAPELVHALRLVAEQLVGLRLARANHRLAVVDRQRVIVAGAQLRAVGQLRLELRRLVPHVELARPRLCADQRIGERFEIAAFHQRLAVHRR